MRTNELMLYKNMEHGRILKKHDVSHGKLWK